MTATVDSDAAILQFGVLGPLRVSRGGADLPVGGRQQRIVLAVLLLEANSVVSTTRLTDAILGEHPPPGHATTLQSYIFRLRALLEPGRGRGVRAGVLRTEPGGYRLDTSTARVDATVFEHAVRNGQALFERGDYAAASAMLASGLALWRGAVLADLADLTLVAPVSARLDGLRLTALQARIDADLALGRHAGLIGELDQLIAAYPLQERLHAQRMLALYRSGRQADALTSYRHLHRLLRDEVGISPSADLQLLHQAILDQDATLASPAGIATEAAVGGSASADSSIGSGDGTAAGSAPTAATQPRQPAAAVAVGTRRPRRHNLLVGATVAAALLVAASIIAMVIARNLPRSSLSSLPANSVGVIDADGSLRDAVPVGENPKGLAYADGSLWVANGGDGTVSKIDLKRHAVEQTIRVGDHPSALASSGHDVWVVNSGDGTVSRINTTIGQVVGEPIQVGAMPDAVTVTGSSVWVANGGDDTIVRIDPDHGTTGKPIDVGDGPDGLTLGAGSLWVGNGRDATVLQVDPETGSVSAPIRVGAGAAGIAVADG